MMRTPVTTVLEPAANADLLHLVDVKEDLGVPNSEDDQFLGRVISRVSAIVAKFCNRVLAAERVRDDFAACHQRGPAMATDDALQLARFPIVIDDDAPFIVVEGGAELSAEHYAVDRQNGLVFRVATDGARKPWAQEEISVTYTGGFRDIPLDIQDAAFQVVKAKYFERGRDPMVRSENISGIAETSYWFGSGPASGSQSGLAPDVEAALSHYRIAVTARGS